MFTRNCDICKKAIKKDKIEANYGYNIHKDFCLKCGKPVFDFLKKHKLLSNEEK